MKVYAVFGDPIEHSLSPPMQNAAFKALWLNASYHAFRVSKSRLGEAILGADAMGFGGLNLTIPLKEEALKFVRPDETAMAMGAVNTVAFGDEIRGYNTDGIGAQKALEDAGAKVAGKRILIIGAGGAAKSIAYQLARSGGLVTIANRDKRRAIELARRIGGQGFGDQESDDQRIGGQGLDDQKSDDQRIEGQRSDGQRVGCRGFGLEDLERLVPEAQILINATSVGMKEGDPRIVDPALLRQDLLVFDVVYNRKTELLKDADLIGAKTLDGASMLVHQGACAIEIWTGLKAPTEVMEEALRKELDNR